MPTTSKGRLVLGVVRTFCSTLEARLYARRAGEQGATYSWEAGTIQPYKPAQLGSGQFDAEDDETALTHFRNLMLNTSVLKHQLWSHRPVSKHLLQVVPKPTEQNCPASLRPPVGEVRAGR